MRQVASYIPRASRLRKGEEADEGTRMDAQVSVPAGVGGRAGVPVAGGRCELAEPLVQEESGGSGGPPPPEASREPLPRPRHVDLIGMSLSPGERRIYRVGHSMFRVWVDKPDAAAEIYKSGEWIRTPILTSAIIIHPHAEALTAHEVAELQLRSG